MSTDKYTDDQEVTVVLTGREAHYVRASVRHTLLKRQREVAKSSYIPPDGKRHSGEAQAEVLETALEKIRAAIRDIDKEDQ